MCENYIVGISVILREKVFESFHLTVYLQPSATLQGKQKFCQLWKQCFHDCKPLKVE